MTLSDATYKLPPIVGATTQSAPRATLLIDLPSQPRAVVVRGADRLVLGRSKPADIVLGERSLSRQHARVSWSEGRVLFMDLGSTNGMRYGGESVTRATLGDGDRIELGDLTVHVHLLGEARPRGAGWLSGSEFDTALRDEVERGRAFRQPFTLLALRSFGGTPPGSTLDGCLRPVDRACAHALDLTLVMLPLVSEAEAEATGRAWLARLGARVAAGVVSFPRTAASADALVTAAVHAARSASESEPLVSGAFHAVEPEPAGERIVRSPVMRRLYELIERVSRTDIPVLVFGETGSGKELAAQAVHESSPRSAAPFRAVNCATLPGTLIESVLFGHERGAFTGADKRTAGIFEQADGGTVFLDEVGELSANAQAALLRVLETGVITRVGSTKDTQVDVRIVAATHRNLHEMVEQGLFRQDLLFRLDVVSVRVPPLRARPEEVEPLAQRFLAGCRKRWGVGAEAIGADAMSALRSYQWPGNVRELRNAVERAAAVCVGLEIGVEDLPEAVQGDWRPPATTEDAEDGSSFADRIRAFEIELISDALRKADGNQTRASELLGIPRRTLSTKVKAYGLR